MSKKRKLKFKIGEFLCQTTDLSEEQVQEALGLQIKEEFIGKKMLGEILVDMSYVTKEEVETALAIQNGYGYILVSNYNVQEDALKIIPKDFAFKYKILPLEKKGDVLIAAVVSPYICDFPSEILQRFGYKIRFFLSCNREIMKALRKYYV
ncbi:MAG: hypothetical protein L6416_00960 [Candidatus Omnitrophica bacterium]|nr:hypothetical protein [Candidatus Omnitrophota bacterium]